MAPGKTIFITGAAAGIGAATARLFASNGWSVGAADIDMSRLEALRAELGPERCSVFVADVRDRAAVVAAVAAFAAVHGNRLDAAFANAGVLFMGPDESLTPEQKSLLIDVNVYGVMHTFDAALPFLKQTPGAHAVAMSSTSAEYGPAHFAVYGATKFFVRGLTEALNLEYRRADINFSAIYVSFVRTGMVLDAEVKAASIETLGVREQPDDVARTVWRAVHGKRAHWRVGLAAKATHLAVRLLGSWVAPLYLRATRL
jgi:NADP-dependent 3-hydroxy acid dehydrogenase YdfG